MKAAPQAKAAELQRWKTAPPEFRKRTRTLCGGDAVDGDARKRRRRLVHLAPAFPAHQPPARPAGCGEGRVQVTAAEPTSPQRSAVSAFRGLPFGVLLLLTVSTCCSFFFFFQRPGLGRRGPASPACSGKLAGSLWDLLPSCSPHRWSGDRRPQLGTTVGRNSHP